MKEISQVREQVWRQVYRGVNGRIIEQSNVSVHKAVFWQVHERVGEQVCREVHLPIHQNLKP